MADEVSLRDRLPADVVALEDALVDVRRDLHRHPELAHEEHRTAALVADRLRGLGWAVREGVGGTGVVGLLGPDDGPVVLFRADMDALPLDEETGLPYASVEPGRMHACGHDAHVAIALGVAELLVAEPELPGRVKLMFQPAEEGEGGALGMLADGVLEDPGVQAAFALHVSSDLAVGRAAVREGTAFAGCRDFRIVIRGEGGHAAMPHATRDALLCGSSLVTALQSAVARRVDPMESAVLTVATFHAGLKTSVIAATAELTGTLRAHSAGVLDELEGHLRRMADGVAAAHGCEAAVETGTTYPPVVNEPGWAARVRRQAVELLGAARVGREILNGSEDMSQVFERVPGCYFLVGARVPGREATPHHSPDFMIDERCLLVGTALARSVLLDALHALSAPRPAP